MEGEGGRHIIQNALSRQTFRNGIGISLISCCSGYSTIRQNGFCQSFMFLSPTHLLYFWCVSETVLSWCAIIDFSGQSQIFWELSPQNVYDKRDYKLVLICVHHCQIPTNTAVMPIYISIFHTPSLPLFDCFAQRLFIATC